MTSHLKINHGVYPVQMLPYGDDGKVKPFHVLRCMHQPRCDAELRLSPGEVRRLPPHAIIKRAHQRGWLADRRGYCLCPIHKPTGMSTMPPEQKRAAYCAIRERNMRAAGVGKDDLNGARNVEIMITQRDALLDRAERDPFLKAGARTALRALLPAIERGENKRGWRRAVAESIPMHESTFAHHVTTLVDRGYLVRVPNSHRLALRHAKEEHRMETEQDTAAPIIAPEPPRQPTLEDNRTIRTFLDDHYDEAAGRWCDDWSDQKAAERLNVPRAWVSAVRSGFYGEDVNEAQEKQLVHAAELAEVAKRLKDDALGIATRAEDLERACRKLLG